MQTSPGQRRIAVLLMAGIAGAVTASHAQVNQYGNPMKHPPKPTTAAITAEELRTRLYIFADDSMQGRQAGTVGNMKGTAYIASELQRLGVEPAGDNGGYFQRLPYVIRHFAGTPALSVNGVALNFGADFVAVPGTRAPRSIVNVPVIYGGVDGDTTRQITPADAAGKFVVLSPAAAPAARGGLPAGNPPTVPAGCPVPAAGGRGGFGPGGNFAGGRGGGVSAAARFPDAIAIATVDLDGLTPAQRMAINAPTRATNIDGGRGGAAPYDYTANPAKVSVPDAAYRGTAGDMIVNNGNQIAVVRNGAVISGTLPAGWTAASAVQKWKADSSRSADSAVTARERTDTLISAARRILASGGHAGTATFHGTAITLDSIQVVSLGCAPAGGRGGAGRGGAGGGRAGGGGGRGAAGGPPAGGPIAATFRITTAAFAKIFGNRSDPGAGASAGTATASLDFVETPSDWGRNVVGIVRGSDPKLRGEYVAIGGHNDHNGLTTPVDHDSLKAWNNERLRLEMQVVKGDLRAITPEQTAAIRVNMDSIRKLHPVARMDSVANGADDDGSGSMAVLEVAEAIARMPVKPKRSILFVWHTGEEAGLLGSAYFTANPTVPIDSIVAQINIDMIGRGRAEDMVGGGPTYVGAVGSKRLSSDLNKEMLAVNASEPAGRRLRIDYRFDDPTLGISVDGKPASWPGYNNIYGRSDHANYANKCIPIVFFFTGLHGDYHQRTDEPQYIDYPHYSMITNYVRDLMVDIANRPTRPALDRVCARR